METLTDEQRYDLAYNLYHARKALAACDPGDINGRADVLHRIRHIEEQLGPLDEKAFADFVLRMDEVVKNRARIIRERFYEKTGVIAND
jgi:hypothetical protein